MHHVLEVTEDAPVRDLLGAAIDPPKRLYEAVKHLFKRGHEYRPGEQVALDEETAQRFLALGEIKESE